MPRKPRKKIDQPATLYHVVCRGNNQRKIFCHPRDYKKFLIILKETKEKYPFYLYTVSLIPNHYHLEIETREFSLSKILHQINTSYVKYFNRRYNRSGHLFQDRFYCSVVDKENYFWELARYIDLNALKANLVKKIEDYRWESFRVYVKIKNEFPEGLIDEERFLQYWDERGNIEKARKNYLQFVRDGIEIIKTKKEPCFILDKKFV